MPRRIALPLAEWPPLDRYRWLDVTDPSADLFDDDGRAAHLSASTKADFLAAYGRWLAFIQHSEPKLLTFAPAARVTRDRIEAFVGELARTNRQSSIVAQLDHLRQMLGYIAPEMDWTWLKAIIARLRQRASPKPKRHRIRTSDELYALGCRLIAQAEVRVGNVPVSPELARLYRDGLIFAFIAKIPLRRRNLVGLTLGADLRQDSAGWQVVIAAEETKTKTALDYPIDEHLGALINRFVQAYRDALPGAAAHGRLWASSISGGMSGNAVWDMVRKRTTEAFGVPMTLHFARDGAATLWALAAPDDYLGMRDVLGHASLSTTEVRYVQVQTRAAAKRLWRDVR